MTYFSLILQLFQGNRDQQTPVYHDLVPPIKARYIRFVPKRFNDERGMRIELYGCQGNNSLIVGLALCGEQKFVLFLT